MIGDGFDQLAGSMRAPRAAEPMAPAPGERPRLDALAPGAPPPLPTDPAALAAAAASFGDASLGSVSKLVSGREARHRYCLTSSDLCELPAQLKPNPSTPAGEAEQWASPMRFYPVAFVQLRALERWGSVDAIDAALQAPCRAPHNLPTKRNDTN